MGQNPGDEKPPPSLELPSFPGFGRRKKHARDVGAEEVESRPAPAMAPPRTEVEETTELSSPTPHETPVPDSAAPPRGGERRAPKRAGGRAGRARRGAGRPLSLPGPLAAALTGLLIGVAGGAGTYGALAGCEAVRGVSSCGGGAGFLLLVGILAVLVLLGAGVLKLLGVPAPASTSFLAVGIIAVVVMLLLLDVVYSPWMFVVVPTLGVAAYLLAHWVTTRFDAATPQRPDWT